MKTILILIAVIAIGASVAFLNTSGSRSSATKYSESSGDPFEEKIEVYEGVSVAKSTRILVLSNRNLSGSLKAEIRQLQDLEELNLSNNNFTGLPAEVGQLTKLRILNLSNNPFTGLPNELGNLKNLEVLNLSGTNYSEADLEVIKQGLSAKAQIITN